MEAGNTRRSRGPQRAGFSMLELMIAISLLLVALMAAMYSQASSMELVRTTRETETAMSDLQAAMEQILLNSPDQIPIPGSTYAAGIPIAAYTDLHLRNERIVPTYPNYTGGVVVPDPLQIRLTLTWNDFKDRQRSMQIVTTRTR